MNGGVNSTMEEPMEISLPASPTTKEQSTDEHSSENNCEISSGENRPSEEVIKQEPTDDDTQKSNEIENNDKILIREIPSLETEESSQENSINTLEENLCGNTSDSNTESLDSSQTKSVNNAMEKMDISVPPEEVVKEVQVDIEFEEDSLGSEISAEPLAEDTLSITSETFDEHADDESSQESYVNTLIQGIVLSRRDEKENDEHCPPARPHREGSSDGAGGVRATGGIGSVGVGGSIGSRVRPSVPESLVQLRRSSRAVKRKRYNDEGPSDAEMLAAGEQVRRGPRPMVASDATPKQMRAGQAGGSSDDPTVDGNTGQPGTSARSDSPTPGCSSASASAPPSAPAAQPNILPSLSDDMFVVEAPSFIVPYVYEKPSVRLFREFVDVLANQIQEQIARDAMNGNDEREEEMENQGTEERQDGGDGGEGVGGGQEDIQNEGQDEENEGGEKKKKRDVKKAQRRRGRNDDDDASWDGESSSDTDDEIVSDEDDKTIVIKGKVDSMKEIKNLTGLTVDKVVTGRSDNYFDCSLGKFFMNIGLSFVQEFVQNDLIKQQNKKLHREKKAGHNTRATETSIASLRKNLELSKENNAPYRWEQKKCEFCSFKSDSLLVMAHHLETPHMRNNLYKCNYCAFAIRSPHDILYHMEAEHNVRGKLERAPAYHQCANCPFEDNGKGKLARHLIPCSKKFKPEANLAPPIDWEPPAKIPKMTRTRSSMMSSYQGAAQRGAAGAGGAALAGRAGGALSGVTVTAGGGAGAGAAAGAGAGAAYRARGRSPLAAPSRGPPALGGPLLRGGVMIRHAAPAPVLVPANFPITAKADCAPFQSNGKSLVFGKSMHQPSISITPLPRQPLPTQPQPAHQGKSTFVICEICDGYIKDLEQLRNHMQWIHKVKIHPKMIYNRPPLNCQKCQCRFFTDQGLERHLLGSHGLVTSSMQEAANKGKDEGRCPVCGRVYQWKLLNHVARDHNLTLKPAHLSYKCTVCTATFGMYKQFENHVYSAHSVVAKRVMEKSKMAAAGAAAKASGGALLKPLKINDEITIIPQPIKPAMTYNK